MAQIGWVYLDDFGGQHRVGLYHGDRTGHVLLHCDLRVVQVDFSVKESRVYSFFVEDELCEVHIFKEKNGFSYEFQVNKKIDTPRNRLRKADDRRTRKYLGFVVAGLVLVVSSLVLGLRWWGQHHRDANWRASGLGSGLTPATELRLAEEGKTAVAELLIVKDTAQRRVFYGFTAENGQRISGRFAVPDTGAILLPNGFPLSDGHTFTVRYLPASPWVHLLDFERPTPHTLEQYLQAAYQAEWQAHPQLSKGHSLCLAQLTLQEKGWRRLADVIFQSAAPAANARNNRDSYLRLIREPQFASLVDQSCWDK